MYWFCSKKLSSARWGIEREFLRSDIKQVFDEFYLSAPFRSSTTMEKIFSFALYGLGSNFGHLVVVRVYFLPHSRLNCDTRGCTLAKASKQIGVLVGIFIFKKNGL